MFAAYRRRHKDLLVSYIILFHRRNTGEDEDEGRVQQSHPHFQTTTHEEEEGFGVLNPYKRHQHQVGNAGYYLTATMHCIMQALTINKGKLQQNPSFTSIRVSVNCSPSGYTTQRLNDDFLCVVGAVKQTRPRGRTQSSACRVTWRI